VKELLALVADATAGDPMSDLRWTYKSLRKLAKALRQKGHAIGAVTVGRLLKEADYSLRTKESRQNNLPDFLELVPMLQCRMQLLTNGLLRSSSCLYP
jgi:hypothetical protein